MEGLNLVVESETRVVIYRVNPALARTPSNCYQQGLEFPQAHQNEGLAILARLAEAC